MDYHYRNRRPLDNLEGDIESAIEQHKQDGIECDVVDYVDQTLNEQYTYYTRHYYNGTEIQERITEYFEANDAKKT